MKGTNKRTKKLKNLPWARGFLERKNKTFHPYTFIEFDWTIKKGSVVGLDNEK